MREICAALRFSLGWLSLARYEPCLLRGKLRTRYNFRGMRITRSCNSPVSPPCAILFGRTARLGYTYCGMRPFSLLFFALLPAAILGNTPPKTPVPDNFQKEALVFQRSETEIRMHADGTGERDTHVCLRLQSEGAARQFGVLPSLMLQPRRRRASTLSAWSNRTARRWTPVRDAMDMQAAVTREAPLYSDLKEKHLPVVHSLPETRWSTTSSLSSTRRRPPTSSGERPFLRLAP